jgi:thiol-disulfide isomerase/thioredoxin
MTDKTVLCCWLALTVFCLVPLTAYSASGQRLPDVSFPDIEGQTQSLRHWQGKKLLVNFWATWCAPCRKEMPDLASLQTELKAQGLQVIGIAIDDAISVHNYLQKNPVNYPILLAPDVGILLSAELGNRMGVLPFSVFVDKDGIVEFTHIGLITKDMVKGWVRSNTVNGVGG